jgi:chaperone modulatory protein CbpM
MTDSTPVSEADIDTVLAEAAPLDRIELERWIAARWVAPRAEGGGWRFTAIDVARVRLIREIRHDLGVEDETVPVVLSLLDQLHATRRTLRSVLEALQQAPPEIRASIAARLGPREPL